MKCPIHGVDRTGTHAATLAAWETIRLFGPDLFISAGTAGGFKSKGANIGDVFIGCDSFKYHNKHIPVEGFELFLIGQYRCLDAVNLSELFGIKRGVISTGDSVHADHSDIAKLTSNNSQCKDMEAAAITEIAQLCNIPMISIKAITDFVDIHEDTYQQFIKNYQLSVNNLTEKVTQVTKYVYGKKLREL